MMTGTISNYRPQIRLYVKGPGGHGVIEFTVDTGFTGTLALSAADCDTLKLPLLKIERTRLADGTEIILNVHRLAIEWHGEMLDADVLVIGEEPLLGAIMLSGSELCLNFSANTLSIKVIS